MGTYISLTDLRKTLPGDELVALTDDDGAGRVDETIVTQAIAEAEAELDSYCGRRYSLPLTATTLVKSLALRLTRYKLASRRSLCPEDVRRDYEDALVLLKALAKGETVLDGCSLLSEPSSSADYASGGEVGGKTPIFGRDNFN